jgi:hypothetical protein
MTEIVTSGSTSGEGRRSDGLLGESDDERRRLFQAPPVLHTTAPLLDSTARPVIVRNRREISSGITASANSIRRCAAASASTSTIQLLEISCTKSVDNPFESMV